MRVIALLSTFVATTLAFKFKAAVPQDANGRPLSHQLPELNLKLTGAGASVDDDIGTNTGKPSKRGLANDYYQPSAAELASIARQFDGLIPGMCHQITLNDPANTFVCFSAC